MPPAPPCVLRDQGGPLLSPVSLLYIHLHYNGGGGSNRSLRRGWSIRSPLGSPGFFWLEMEGEVDEVQWVVSLGPEGPKLPLEKLRAELYKPFLDPALVPMRRE